MTHEQALKVFNRQSSMLAEIRERQQKEVGESLDKLRAKIARKAPLDAMDRVAIAQYGLVA